MGSVQRIVSNVFRAAPLQVNSGMRPPEHIGYNALRYVALNDWEVAGNARYMEGLRDSARSLLFQSRC
jgi:hypothetical protein